MLISLLFEELFFLSSSVLLIYLASRLKFGLKRSIYLLFAWLNSLMLSIVITVELFNEGLAPEEFILSIYSFSILGGLVIHFYTNLRRKKVYKSAPYRLNTNLNLKKSQY